MSNENSERHWQEVWFVEHVFFCPIFFSLQVTPDGRVSKTILSAGNARKVKIGDAVALQYEGFFEGSSGGRVRFDSTVDRGLEFSFVVLSEPTLLGLENAILTMTEGEKSVVRMSSEYAFGASGGRFHGFGKTVPGGATVEMEITVVNVSSKEDLAHVDREREKPLAERMNAAGLGTFVLLWFYFFFEWCFYKKDALRSEGNVMFKANDFVGALQCYKRAIALIRLVNASEEDVKIRRTLLVPLCLNVAQCLLNQSLVKEAEAYVLTALHEDPEHAKGLYRMALCKFRLEEHEEAKEYALRARTKHDSVEVRHLLSKINEALVIDTKKQEASYKKIFETK
jgi:hypothetical protein